MTSDPKPLYGTIAYFGGWSVTFDCRADHHSRSLSGYGEFPRDRFAGIPVIDFRSLDGPGLPDAKFPSLPFVAEAYAHHTHFSRYVSLADYLAECERCGIVVFRA